MDTTYPADWASLKHPWTRQELLDTLHQVAADNPCAIWEQERQKDLLSGFSFIVDWLFDAVVIDEGGIGFCLFDMDEVRAVDAVKKPVHKISAEMPDASEAEVISHPLWPEVKRLSKEAVDKLESRA